MSDGLHKVHLNLTKDHAKRLLRGNTIQLKPEHLLESGGRVLHLHKHKHTAHHRAMRHKKGVRLHLDPYELEVNGGALSDVIQGIKQGVKNAYAAYQKNPELKAAVRQGLKTAGKYGLSALQAVAPGEFSKAIETGQKYVDPALDYIGNTTGAFGLKKHRGRKSKKALAEEREMHSGRRHLHPGDDFSPLISDSHPASHPVPNTPVGDGVHRHHGHKHLSQKHCITCACGDGGEGEGAKVRRRGRPRKIGGSFGGSFRAI